MKGEHISPWELAQICQGRSTSPDLRHRAIHHLVSDCPECREALEEFLEPPGETRTMEAPPDLLGATLWYLKFPQSWAVLGALEYEAVKKVWEPNGFVQVLFEVGLSFRRASKVVPDPSDFREFLKSLKSLDTGPETALLWIRLALRTILLFQFRIDPAATPKFVDVLEAMAREVRGEPPLDFSEARSFLLLAEGSFSQAYAPCEHALEKLSLDHYFRRLEFHSMAASLRTTMEDQEGLYDHIDRVFAEWELVKERSELDDVDVLRSIGHRALLISEFKVQDPLFAGFVWRIVSELEEAGDLIQRCTTAPIACDLHRFRARFWKYLREYGKTREAIDEVHRIARSAGLEDEAGWAEKALEKLYQTVALQWLLVSLCCDA